MDAIPFEDRRDQIFTELGIIQWQSILLNPTLEAVKLVFADGILIVPAKPFANLDGQLQHIVKCITERQRAREGGMAAKRGRPAAQQPVTVYDYRRAIALVDVLAIEDYEQRSQHIQTLALDWQVCNQYELSTLVMTQIIQRLAQHVLEHGRGEADGEAQE